MPEKIEFSMPCSFKHLDSQGKKLVFYSIAYNASIGYKNGIFTDMTNPEFVNDIAVQVKKNLDEAILIYFAGESKDEKVSSSFKEYKLMKQNEPKFALRFFRGDSFITDIGSFIFSLAPSVRYSFKTRWRFWL